MRAQEFVNETWSKKYKRSIDCAHPKGFSQRAHCAGRKKHNEDDEQKLDELSFMGSQCTKDCSGHRAGYSWSKARGGTHAASWSNSFNKGAAIAASGQ